MVVFANWAITPGVVNATEVTVASAFLSIRLENDHDLQGVLGTFGDAARYDDEPWGEH
jgi:hypothetical protein